jgi:hypothetical protein
MAKSTLLIPALENATTPNLKVVPYSIRWKGTTSVRAIGVRANEVVGNNMKMKNAIDKYDRVVFCFNIQNKVAICITPVIY